MTPAETIKRMEEKPKRERHGQWLKDRKTYQTWCDMKSRCYNKKSVQYNNYGGRGITVCEEWRSSFAAFKADMGSKPDGLTIERKDNNGPYCKENCVWATRQQQRVNQRTCRYITFAGETRVMRDWAKFLGISEKTIQSRLRLGRTESEALTAPIDLSKSHRARFNLGEKKKEG